TAVTTMKSKIKTVSVSIPQPYPSSLFKVDHSFIRPVRQDSDIAGLIFDAVGVPAQFCIIHINQSRFDGKHMSGDFYVLIGRHRCQCKLNVRRKVVGIFSRLKHMQ
ncbi:MAG: hypothetical protein ABI144_09795, partial [Gallionella sp.]